jgi:hypothetical protein
MQGLPLPLKVFPAKTQVLVAMGRVGQPVKEARTFPIQGFRLMEISVFLLLAPALFTQVLVEIMHGLIQKVDVAGKVLVKVFQPFNFFELFMVNMQKLVDVVGQGSNFAVTAGVFVIFSGKNP